MSKCLSAGPVLMVLLNQARTGRKVSITLASGLAASATGSWSKLGSSETASTRHRDSARAQSPGVASTRNAPRAKTIISSMWYTRRPRDAKAWQTVVVPVWPIITRRTFTLELTLDSAAKPARDPQT
eukprot:CAMPEP_0198513874 /NCGR_PEP_ID=MMETSP1462-20131121/16336_1 /TAXON_ID=1333877 /ORGANISM="Brandtodinium nutriculum, Strain RCC3387" /LENGTH=126 /DNA_ID=CAMNT_0044243303 /DNA_START=461 /DNA_END=837 /DNA_ORIENTATION=-